MKKLFSVFGYLSFVILSGLLSGCMKDKLTRTYKISMPVLADKSTVLASIGSNTPQELKSPGKVFMIGRYVFVNEVNKGVHVLDNTNPEQPKAVTFIPIPGNLDIAVKGNILYADMYTDLIAVDISNPLNAKLVKSIPQLFPERNYIGSTINYDTSKIIVDWITRDTVVNAESFRGPWLLDCMNCFMFEASSSASKSVSSIPGLAGSMARFSIVNNYLYTVNSYMLGVFDISLPEDPIRKNEYNVGWGIETVYPFKDKLFIGSTTGMFIYDISQPEALQPLGQFAHANSCDPVVADDQFAYVTLRSGNECMGFINQLDIINIEDVMHPNLLKTYPMKNPHGLAKDGDLLFICDGEYGLKVYDAGNTLDLKLIHYIPNINAYDVIAWDSKLLVVASNGLYQYDYSDRESIRLLSTYRTSGK